MTPLVTGETGRRRCLECGAHVPTDFRRVYGDERDRAHRCPQCDTWVRLFEGSAAGKSVSTPDAREAPGRHGPSEARWFE
ncbi:Zinc finger protein [Halalkaliarchaeum sp. AArc-CO]|uniref:DUF7563 family protein n=1 Tax=unclassified Halalkaliarchaeum TaxID=2678344 RepID=UPI00217F1DE0|nr:MULTISPECIES: hypothetical protein [unclassified Halalkaliarchaeum]MDR5674373.1 hypothetical protein [Halalkaliarchaeum sp. AArc-GB]UWG52188.1 Zinc finger protein [Halalkaliarchaeum sp. AArc-CO]